MSVLTRALDTPELRELLDRLSEKAAADYYNPYRTFDWPASLPTDRLWMSPDLLSVHGTPYEASLSEEQLYALSRWESVNFYSLNVHGIRELLIEVTRRIHRPGFGPTSEFFHHFIGEENEHMWFFARFCLRYGGKIYPDRSLTLGQETGGGGSDPAVADFLVFARILIFEQIVDYYNMRMAADESLAPTIRAVNRVHHQDESRHIACGSRIVELLWRALEESDKTAEQLDELRAYLKRYTETSIENFYNPSCYRDANIPDGFALRQRLLADPARQEAHRRVLSRTNSFLRRTGILAGH
ncbi:MULTISPECIES: diiron oxygenase [Actinomycetes]|uniref:Diiron oxygenase n=1 Tax=Streptomyces nondiastaticus TaxID=3154512 RepID=A0ABW6UAZ8_9ACTN|nr:diiron oxygenase [Streptosporangium nondiastaticum]